MAGFPASITLSGLSSSTGFRVFGEANGDNAGFSISSAGDVNGDGIEDFIVGSVWNDQGGSNAGAAYVVFGTASGFPSNFSLSGLNGSNGFRIYGKAANDLTGFSVAGGGDINGDGYDDVIVGAYAADPSGSSSGAGYVIFGHSGAFSSSIAVTGLDGSNGFAVTGIAANNTVGFSVSVVGDFNGDGFDDFLVGAPYTSPGVTSGGASYLVFGHGGAFSASMAVSSLNGTNGFRIAGLISDERSGWSVSAAGDFNGDGLQDLVIGAPRSWNTGGVQTGAAYILFGRSGPFTGNMYLDNVDKTPTLDGSNGVKLVGEANQDVAGWRVAGAGDVNGDGIDDVIVSAPYNGAAGTHAGAVYVVFGKTSGFSSTLNLSSLDGTNGFRINGKGAFDQIGRSVAGGDINGDGYADVIIGEPQGSSNSDTVYVVFGHSGTFSASVSLAALDGANGLKLSGPSGSLTGRSVGAADVNSDGVADLLIGAPVGLSIDGLTAPGNAYVVYGLQYPVAWTGGSGDETRNGSALGDTMAGGSGNDALFGLAGNDTLYGDDGNDVIDGGAGADTMSGGTGNDTFLVDDAGDQTNESSGEGYDTVKSSLSWSLGANLEQLVLLGTGDISGAGNGLNNSIVGNAGNNLLDGGAGNDSVYGGDGGDTLHGGLNNDIVNGDAGDDQVYGDEGNDKVNGGDGADHLYGGDGADLMDGGTGDDVLDGGIGNDSLNGGTGADGMTGGAGNDVYYVDDAGDQTIETAGEGTDIVRASISWTLSANIEQLELQGSANLDGAGNELNNRLTGNDGDNAMSGLDGNDTILGGAGNDTIIGGRGNDLMTGGTGADTFVIQAESVYSSKTPAGGHLEIDFVYDLNAGEGDRLDLSAIDADSTAAGDQAFHLIGAFSRHGGEMTLAYSASANQTVLSLDVDGDGRADYQMKIAGDVHLESGGWIL